MPRLMSEYHVHEELAVDEAVIPFKGRLGFKQYMKDKPTKWGIKVFVLEDSINGYVKHIQICTGKNSELSKNEVGLASNVVLELLEGLEQTHPKVHMDNHYSSPALFVKLWTKGINACEQFEDTENTTRQDTMDDPPMDPEMNLPTRPDTMDDPPMDPEMNLPTRQDIRDDPPTDPEMNLPTRQDTMDDSPPVSDSNAEGWFFAVDRRVVACPTSTIRALSNYQIGLGVTSLDATVRSLLQFPCALCEAVDKGHKCVRILQNSLRKPKTLPADLLVQKVDRGYYDYHSLGPLLACLWMDKRVIHFLMTLQIMRLFKMLR